MKCSKHVVRNVIFDTCSKCEVMQIFRKIETQFTFFNTSHCKMGLKAGESGSI